MQIESEDEVEEEEEDEAEEEDKRGEEQQEEEEDQESKEAKDNTQVIKFLFCYELKFLIKKESFGFVWFLSCLAETSQTPFDFVEGILAVMNNDF